MNLTKNQIETLKGKCHECNGMGAVYGYDEGCCILCKGTGKVTIEIEKVFEDKSFTSSGVLGELTPKYKVGDEIEEVKDA